MRAVNRRASVMLAAVLAAGAGACDFTSPNPGGRLQRVEGLVPGSTARILGRGLASLGALTVDGVPATDLVVVSDGEATFRVPVVRECETDGRGVMLVADGTDTLSARMQVEGAISMEVGESRVITPADLACLRLAARDEDYVISVVGTGIPTGDAETVHPVLLLRSWTEAGNWPDWVEPGLAVQEAAPRHPPATLTSAAPVIYSDNPIPFDTRYATAQVGGTVTMVDWKWDVAQNEAICQLPKAQVPTFEARVVAATPRIVIAVDLRNPHAATFLDGATNAWLQTAATIAESALLPTMRAVFDPGFEPLRGGGGRYYALLTTLGGGTAFAYDGTWPGVTGGSQAACPHSSEMTTARLNAAVYADAGYRDPQALASTLIHEYAHNAEARVHLRADRPSNSAWYLNEAWASVAEETASRVASQQPQGALRSKITGSMPYSGTMFYGLWGRQQEAGPWQMRGRYTVSASMLMYVRELVGEIPATTRPAPTFHQRLYETPRDWTDRPGTLPVFAAAAGLTYEELVDRHALAAVTAGLLSDAVIQQRQLPHFRGWDMRELAAADGPRTAAFKGKFSRTRNQRVDLLVADGGFGAIYLMADGGKGISIQNLRQQPHPSGKIRLTRLR